MRKRRPNQGEDPYLPANVAPMQRTPVSQPQQVPAGYGYGYADFVQGMDESEKSFRDYLDIVLSRIRLVLLIFLSATVISAAYTFTRTPLYTSEAVIEPETAQGVTVGDKSLYDKSVGNLANQLEIFSSSRSLAEAFKMRITFEEFPELNSRKTSWRDGLVRRIPFVGSLFPETTEPVQAVNGMASPKLNVPVRASAKSSKKSGLLTVSMTAENPRLAQKMLDAYLDLYLKRNLENRRAESLEAADWLKKELDEVNKKLIESQTNLVSFTIDHGIVDSRDGGIGQVMSIVNRTMEKRIRSQENQDQLSMLEKEAQGQGATEHLPSSGKSEYIGKLKGDIAIMESEYTQMAAVYSENYPKLVLMKKKIKFLKDRILTMEKDSISAAKQFAEKEQQAVQQSLQAASKEASRVQVLEAQYLTLKKEVDTNLEFQKMLLKEYKQMHIKARTIGNNLRMIDSPTLPVTPSWPETTLFMLIGCLVGLVGGIAMAFVANAFDDTIKHHSELEKELGLRKLGVVPDMTRAAHLHNLDEESTDFEFVAHDKPKSPMSDAIRNVQTSIMLSNMDDPVRSLCVSSSVPGEGKTTVALSLATVLTVAGTRRVVLVDADMRKPRVHKALGLTEPGPGLADLLNGLKAPLDDVLRPHRIPGFFYITAGQIPQDPISLISGDKMQLLMDELHERFDYIVVDCPPILGFSDTPIISTYVDGVVLVVEPGKVMKGQVKDAVSSILSVDNGRILGVVMNKADMGTAYGYKYRYGGYLRYGLYGRYGSYGRYGGRYGGDYYGNYKYYSDKT
jgi:polysaccharide biosynthesis transport protein